MVLRIRLARFGKKHAPFYNIVVAHARTARNSKPLEVLGTYDPIPKEPPPGSPPGTRKYKDIRLDVPRAKYWVGVGAQPSDTAWRLLSMVGILEPKFRRQQIDKILEEKEGGLAKLSADAPSQNKLRGPPKTEAAEEST